MNLSIGLFVNRARPDGKVPQCETIRGAFLDSCDVSHQLFPNKSNLVSLFDDRMREVKMQEEAAIGKVSDPR